jgi:hypothetical protein
MFPFEGKNKSPGMPGFVPACSGSSFFSAPANDLMNKKPTVCGKL